MYSLYTLYKRNGVYYVRFRDKSGRRLSGISTGETDAKKARRVAEEYLLAGKIDSKDTDSFEKYTRTFFDFEKSEFIRNEKRCGRSYGHRYADDNNRILKNILLPVWKDTCLSKITVSDIEELLFSLLTKYSASRVSAVRNVIASIFKEAYRTDVIPTNPMERVSLITVNEVEKGIYSDSTIEALFSNKALNDIWKGNYMHYCINYLAYSTGLRQGEILALMPSNIFEDHLLVMYSWERCYGLKEPKYKSNRCVPITRKAYCLLKFIIEKKAIADTQFVFSGTDKNAPIDHRSINRRLNDALVRVGISEEERRGKKLTFHSWRHVFTSKLRERIPEQQLKLLTGHKTIRMLEHYSHYDFNAVKNVVPLQEEIFGVA